MTCAPADAFASVLGALLFPAPDIANRDHAGPTPSALVVAFSGGRDSTVLLHLARRYASAHGMPLRAVHINHQLQDAASTFVQHCEQVCEAWGIALTVLPVQVNRSDKGLEADARAARYAAFADNLQAHELLLLGQHADDQIETLLLQLLRGAGPLGLAGMAAVARCGNALLCRPLLQVRRDAMAALAAENQWRWIDDPSNTDQMLARNRLRHELMPVLLAQREGAAEVLLRAVGWQAETVTLLADLAQLDATQVQQENGLLSRTRLLQLPLARQANLLRWWLQQQQLPAPNADRLQVFLQQLPAHSDRVLIRWGAQQLRVAADQIIAVPDWSPEPLPPLTWSWPTALQLPQRLGQLLATPAAAAPQDADNTIALMLRPPRDDETVTLRWQTPGLRLALPGRQGRRELKDVFQAAQIPAWLRPLWPKLFYNDELMALPGLLVTVAGTPNAAAAGWQLQSTGPLFTLARRLQTPGAAAAPATH